MPPSLSQRQEIAQRDAEILRLRGEGLSYAQIGAALGLPKATVSEAFIRAGLVRRYAVRGGVTGPSIPAGAFGIALSNGLVALVDLSDASWVVRHNWRISNPRTRHVLRSGRAGAEPHNVWLHREIIGAGPGQIVDHINGNPLDNRRSNLRLCTSQENSWNGRKRSEIQPFKGVRPSAQSPEVWESRIGVNGKLLWLGSYNTADDAARAYDAAATEHFGEFARLNFPDVASVAPQPRVQRVARGEGVKGSKLGPALVLQIRHRHAAGETAYALARTFGVCDSTISAIVHRRTWRHIPGAT